MARLVPPRYTGFAALAVMAALALWLGHGRDGGNAPPAAPRQSGDAATKPSSPKPAPAKPAPPPRNGNAPAPAGSGFDYYVLALSWSPSYCQSEEGAGNRQQCAAHRDLSLVVHGFWPQRENGYPEFCDSREPDRVPDDLARRQLDLLPSVGLVGHQWRKHGTCSGLTQRAYFDTLRAARNRVALPAELRSADRQKTMDTAAIAAALAAANPGLSASAIDITCDGSRLDEIRICMTRDLKFRDCAGADRRVCRRDRLVLPAAP